MSTNSEQQTTATDAAGCKSEADRSVQGTDLRSGFAELRARAKKRSDEAHLLATHRFDTGDQDGCDIEDAVAGAFQEMIVWIDELSGCEECKLGGS